jgi:SanA protein
MRTRTLPMQRSQPGQWVPLLKTSLKATIAVAFGGMVLILLCNWWVVRVTNPQNYFTLSGLPPNDIGLVLGTSKAVVGGQENLFFRYRMEAAARLYREGKVKRLILSGNNDSEYYNEPSDMRQALLRLGVPDEVMIPDYAGRRTYDSILRCREVFGQNQITVISQPFHNARALFLARALGVDAVGFSAQDVPDGYSLRTLMREYLARPRALLDVYLLSPDIERHNQPITRKKS